MGHTTGLIHSTTFHMLCSHCNSYCAHCCLSILKGGKQDSYRALGTTSVTANHNLGMNLLLIFFIVTMSSYVEMTLLETNLPTSGGSDAEKIDLQNSLKIELSASGDYIVNGIPQSRDALENLLRRYARLMPDANRIWSIRVPCRIEFFCLFSCYAVIISNELQEEHFVWSV